MIATKPGHYTQVPLWRRVLDDRPSSYSPPVTGFEKVLAAASGELAFRDAWAAVEDMPATPLRRGLVSVLHRYRDGEDEYARELLGLLIDRFGTIPRMKPRGRPKRLGRRDLRNPRQVRPIS